MHFYCSLSGQTRVQGPALCQSPLSHIDHSYCINISQWRRMSPPHTYFDSISESNIYDKHARHWNEWVGSPGFVISKFSPTHGGPSGGSERFAEEVPETWHSGQVFRPHLWCRFLLRAHDNRPFLAPPDADLPSPESRMKTPEPPGAQSQERQERQRRQGRQGRVNRPSFLIQNLFIISHCVLRVPSMHMISFPRKCLRTNLISATVASRYKTLRTYY